MDRPNLVILLADQMRAQASGYAGDPNARTPNLDALHEQCISFSTAVSNCPICTPYRACLLTGQYPLTHGLFMNDLCLGNDAPTLAQIYAREGYDTAYIGKWHLDGHGRKSYIPPERRQGFDYWKVLECTHDYLNSVYYAGDDDTLRTWDGYDALAQTEDAVTYIETRANSEKPFVLFLSWGPPHNPYDQVPEGYLAMFPKDEIRLRPDVPEGLASIAREELSGYYAHIAALDECTGRVTAALERTGLAENTILLFTSDHGDSVRSHCDMEIQKVNKQRPYDESVLIPFLLRLPSTVDDTGIDSATGTGYPRVIDTPLATPDILPTLLSLSGILIPESVEGLDFAPAILGQKAVEQEGVPVASYAPFADWGFHKGGREYRGVRTRRYTYVRTRTAPWLMFDNQQDPYQLRNVVDDPACADARRECEELLEEILRRQQDDFPTAEELRKRYKYFEVDKTGAIPYGP